MPPTYIQWHITVLLALHILSAKMLSAMIPLENISKMDSSYHIGGDLYLPDPATSGLEGEKLAFAYELLPLLKQLDVRDLDRKFNMLTFLYA